MLRSSNRPLPTGAWLFVLLSVLGTDTSAEIYRYRAPDGSIVFTDAPPPGSERVEIHPNPTILPAFTERPTPRSDDEERPASDSAFAYEGVEIASPEEDEAIRANAGDLEVTILVRPPLRRERGDRLLVLLDGGPAGPPSPATTVRLEHLDRGSHTLQAIVVDENGTPMLRSSVRRFHVLRHSRLFGKTGPAQ